MNKLFLAYDKDLPERSKLDLKKDFIQSDKMMMRLVIFHWILASTVMAYNYGLYTFGFINGAFLTLIAYLSYYFYKGTMICRVVMGTVLLLYSVVFIQLQMGRIEMHFHIFMALPLLTRYKDTVPLFAGGITTALYHIIFNFCQANQYELFGIPVAIYNYGNGWGITLLHATFAVASVIIFSGIIIRNTEQLANVQSAQKNAKMVETLTKLANDQAVTIEETSAAVTEIQMTAEETAKHASEADEFWQRASQNSKSGQEAIEHMKESMTRIRTVGTQINGFVDGINKIADQTHLLSLNAAIEAARAGEQGKGFAVVADEVRKLATESSQVTEDIQKLIVENNQRITEGEKSVEVVSTSLEKITERIEDSTTLVSQISHATGQQQIALQEINVSMESLSNNSEQVASFAEEVNEVMKKHL